MTDEYVVVVTTDTALVSDIQNATTMDVIHITNHDIASEKDYRQKIVILDIDTVPVTQQDLSIWHENTSYLIVLPDNQDDDFIEQHQAFISDVWIKPVNSVVLKKRLSKIREFLRAGDSIRKYVGMAVKSVQGSVTSVVGYSEILLTSQKHSPSLPNIQHQFLTAIHKNGLKIMHSNHAMYWWSIILSGEFELTFQPAKVSDLIENIKKTLPVSTMLKTTIVGNNSSTIINKDWLDGVLNSVIFTASQSDATNIGLKVWENFEWVNFQISSDVEFISVNIRDFFFHHVDTFTPVIQYIIEQHGGEIFVETNPETGSAFHFTIPIAQNTDD